MANISYAQLPSGAISLNIGNTQVLSASGNLSTLTQADLTQITSGSIAGNQASITDVNGLLSQLNHFLTSFSNQVNAIQTAGYGLSGTSNAPPIFSLSTDSSGNVALTVNNISSSDIGAASSPGQSGDNSNALNMVALQSNSTVFNNGTFDQGLATMISNVGIEASATTNSENTTNALAQQSSSMRQSISGVDANQQEALMVEYQNTYSAAAKFIGIVDSMLQTLIGMIP
jgi:flagellar hook-associated protein 1 FlgK